MRSEALRTLIELFNKSVVQAEWGAKQYLEIVRAEREESLTFEQLRTRAQAFALWLIQAGDIRIKDKIAILGKNGGGGIGPRFEDSEKLTRRDLRSLRDKFASSLKLALIGFVLGLYWLCFGFDWLCFGFDWLCIGFVFSDCEIIFFSVILCYK